MGLWNLLSKLLLRLIHGKGHGVDELARRLGVTAEELRAVEPCTGNSRLPSALAAGGKSLPPRRI